MFHFRCGMTARLQNIVKPDQIAFHIRIRIGDAVAHARLRRQIYHDIRPMFQEDSTDKLLVRDISSDKNEIPEPVQFPQPFLFQGHVIIIRNGVHAHNFYCRESPEKFQGQITADEPGRTRNEYGLVF